MFRTATVVRDRALKLAAEMLEAAEAASPVEAVEAVTRELGAAPLPP